MRRGFPVCDQQPLDVALLIHVDDDREGGTCDAGRHLLDVPLGELLEGLVGLHVDVHRPLGQAVGSGAFVERPGRFCLRHQSTSFRGGTGVSAACTHY